jgi:DNA-directed RNA polymerase subunit F
MSGSFQFTLDNFKNYSQQLQVIIMSRQNYDPLTNFHKLEPKQKRLFNEELNKYIRALTEEFDKKITEDFNLVCQEEIFPFLNTKYKNMIVRPSNEEELSKETKEYTELIFKNSMLDNQLTETQLNKIPIMDN